MPEQHRRPLRILWVTAEPPDRAGGGGNIRQSRLLEALARAGHDVDLLLAGGEPDDVVRSVAHRVDLVPVVPARRPTGPVSRRLRTLRVALVGGPSELHDNAAARRALGAAWPADPYDLVLVEHAGLAPLVTLRRPGERWVCTLQNVFSGTSGALRNLSPKLRQRWVQGRETQQAQALERFIVQRYDAVVSVSEEDAALLPGPSTVIPNGVDLQVFAPTPLPSEPRLVFTGTLSYLPNQDGLVWFCENVLPLVQAQVPQATLDVVGRDPTEVVREFARRPGVALHADVPSVSPYLEAARVCLVPLRIGTGTRLKALEAMAAGRPTVGTTVGLAGLGITDEAIVLDDPAEMADALVRLLRDDDEATRLADRGRQLAAGFGWEQLGLRFVAAVESVSPDEPAPVPAPGSRD